MAVATQIYGGVTAMTLTGASLANLAARQGLAVINTANKYLDAILSGNITLGATIGNGAIHVGLYGSDATSLADPATGTDAALTLPGVAWASLEFLQPGQLVPGTNLTYCCKLGAVGRASGTAIGLPNVSVSQLFNLGGLGLPPQWGIWIANMTGFTLSASATVLNYNGITQNIA